MRPPRFRLRALMIAMAVVAVLLGGGLEFERQRRRIWYLRLAGYFDEATIGWESWVTAWDRRADKERDPDQAAAARTQAGYSREWASSCGAEAKWYRDTGSRVWPPNPGASRPFSIDPTRPPTPIPDPPPPE
jgi:hypothetical protein